MRLYTGYRPQHLATCQGWLFQEQTLGLHIGSGFNRMASVIRLTLYWRLSRNSRIALRKSKRGWGRPNYYNPQQRLINRLTRETGWSWQKVASELERERNLLLANPSATIYPDFD